MSVIEKLTEREALESALEEAAKSKNELLCAKRDLAKVESRLSFVILIINKLLDRLDTR